MRQLFHDRFYDGRQAFLAHFGHPMYAHVMLCNQMVFGRFRGTQANECDIRWLYPLRMAFELLPCIDGYRARIVDLTGDVIARCRGKASRAYSQRGGVGECRSACASIQTTPSVKVKSLFNARNGSPALECPTDDNRNCPSSKVSATTAEIRRYMRTIPRIRLP